MAQALTQRSWFPAETCVTWGAVRATHSSAGFLLRVRRFPSTQPGAPTQPRPPFCPGLSEQCALILHSGWAGWGKALVQRLQCWWAPQGTRGARERRQLTWQA